MRSRAAGRATVFLVMVLVVWLAFFVAWIAAASFNQGLTQLSRI